MPTPTLTPVSASRVITAVGYDEAERKLYIDIPALGVHVFSDVPPEVHQVLVAANDPWVYYRANVFNKFSGSRVRE